MLLLLKYINITFCSLFFYKKCTHKKISHHICELFLFLLFYIPFICLVKVYIGAFDLFFMILLFAFFIGKILSISFKISLSLSMISFGISYLAFMFALFINYPIVKLFLPFSKAKFFNLFSLISICLIQYCLIALLLKYKRLTNGISFIFQDDINHVGLFICTVLLLAVSFFYSKKSTNNIYLIPLFFVILCGIILIFWIQHDITQKYIKKVTLDRINNLEILIQEKNEEIKLLKEYNNRSSSIIHKDNKLIPAMYVAVKELLTFSRYDDNITLLQEKSNFLLSYINDKSRERHMILSKYEIQYSSITPTTISSIDILLNYMFQKSKLYNIDFDFSLLCDIKSFLSTSIMEFDLETLLADLIENAIIATKNCDSKKIMLCLKYHENIYSLEIYDTGIPFHLETLLAFGIKKTSTHLHEGGSGIGLMTIFQITQKYLASFCLEYNEIHSIYAKKISIIFDKKKQVHIQVNNKEEAKLLSNRNDFIVLYPES